MENKDNLHRGIHFAAKIIGIVVAVTLTLFVGITVLGVYWPDIQDYRYKLEAERFMKEIEEAKKRIAELEKADTFGGSTPEDTFDMFLVALRNNDADLASKYYDVVVQEEALNGLRAELSEKGNLLMSLNYFTEVRGGEKKCNEKMDGCAFEYIFEITEEQKNNIDASLLSEDGKERKLLSMKLSQVSGLWKATQPF